MSRQTPGPDPGVADAIARAERRRAILEELTGVAMALAKDIAQRSMDSPYHPELKHDPGRAFAAASRAVRLTLAFEERIDDRIIALRNGYMPALAPAAGLRALVAPVEAGPRLERAHTDSDRERLWEAIDREIGDGEDLSEVRHLARERLAEREDVDEVLAGDFHAFVADIRADLGLEPEQSATLDVQRPAVADVEVEPRQRQRSRARWGFYGANLRVSREGREETRGARRLGR